MPSGPTKGMPEWRLLSVIRAKRHFSVSAALFTRCYNPWSQRERSYAKRTHFEELTFSSVVPPLTWCTVTISARECC